MRLYQLAFFILSMISSATAEGYLDKDTGVKFPESVGDFKMIHEGEGGTPVRTYQDPRQGYSILYSSDLCQATIYIFDGGFKDIQSGVEGKVVKLFFEQSDKDIYTLEDLGKYEGVKKEAMGKDLSNLVPSEYLGAKYSYNFNRSVGKEKVVSYLFVKGLNKMVFKVRVTGAPHPNMEKSLIPLLNSIKLK